MKTLIDRRVDKMVQEGLLEEVRALLDMGLPRNATAMQAIGYKEFLGVLDGTVTEDEAIAAGKTPLPAVRQAPADLAAAKSGHSLDLLGKRAGILPAPYRFRRKF